MCWNTQYHGKIGRRKNTDSGPCDRQTVKSGEYSEYALYTGFLQECNRHTPISGEIIWEKEKYFYKMITKKDDLWMAR